MVTKIYDPAKCPTKDAQCKADARLYNEKVAEKCDSIPDIQKAIDCADKYAQPGVAHDDFIKKLIPKPRYSVLLASVASPVVAAPVAQPVVATVAQPVAATVAQPVAATVAQMTASATDADHKELRGKFRFVPSDLNIKLGTTVGLKAHGDTPTGLDGTINPLFDMSISDFGKATFSLAVQSMLFNVNLDNAGKVRFVMGPELAYTLFQIKPYDNIENPSSNSRPGYGHIIDLGASLGIKYNSKTSDGKHHSGFGVGLMLSGGVEFIRVPKGTAMEWGGFGTEMGSSFTNGYAAASFLVGHSGVYAEFGLKLMLGANKSYSDMTTQYLQSNCRGFGSSCSGVAPLGTFNLTFNPREIIEALKK